jgi:hypothetical protein
MSELWIGAACALAGYIVGSVGFFAVLAWLDDRKFRREMAAVWANPPRFQGFEVLTVVGAVTPAD